MKVIKLGNRDIKIKRAKFKMGQGSYKRYSHQDNGGS